MPTLHFQLLLVKTLSFSAVSYRLNKLLLDDKDVHTVKKDDLSQHHKQFVMSK